MADISELILQVKNADHAVSEIDKVDKKLKQTAVSSQKINDIGKTLFAGWTFTKIISMTKSMGDAFSNSLITARKFSSVFGLWNRQANAGVKILVNNFHNTERAAKDLMATIGARLDFGFDEKTLGKVSTDLARISHELGSFYGRNVNDVSLKLTQALAGQTKGLKEYGMYINVNGENFLKLQNQIQKATGATKEGSRALAVYSSILGKTKAAEGTFEVQAKSISQIMEDLKNSFIDGPFAQMGKIFSLVFGPMLNLMNKFISTGLGELVTTLLGVVVSLKLSFKTILLLLSKLSGYAGFSSVTTFISKSIFGFVRQIPTLVLLVDLGIIKLLKFFQIGFGKFFTNFQFWLLGKMKLLNVLIYRAVKITPGLTLIFAGLVASLLTVITDGILNAFSKNYKRPQILTSIYRWVENINETVWNTIRNAFRDKNDQIKTRQYYAQNWLNSIRQSRERIDKLEEALSSAENEFKELKIEYSTPIFNVSKAKTNMDSLKKMVEEAFMDYNVMVEQLKYRRAAFEEANAKLLAKEKELSIYKGKRTQLIKSGKYTNTQLKEMGSIVYKLANEADKLKQDFDKSQKEYAELLSSQKNTMDKAMESNKKLHEIQQNIYKMHSNSFSTYEWYQDAIEKIDSSVKPFTSEEKIKKLQERIKKLQEEFSNIYLTPDQAKEKYKLMSEVQVQIFEEEMKALQKEREFIASTNEMIKKYVDQAMQWKAQGVDAIETTSAEGYKFMTSGFGSLAELGPMIQDSSKESNALQIKSNAIATQTKKVIEKIKDEITTLNSGNGSLVQLKIVN